MTRRGGYLGRKTFLRASDGAITIEFVVMFPLIVAALAFSFEFGRIILAHHTVVNNVRSAMRFLSRVDDPVARFNEVEEIVCTGRPSGGTRPNWMGTCTVPPATQTAFSDADFRESGQVLHLEAQVSIPLYIFHLFGNNQTSISINIAEDLRHAGD
jgi:hypothetical protein